MNTNRFACPCCRHLTLEARPSGTSAICPVCFWEDDPVQFADPTIEAGANSVSLAVARLNFLELGAASREWRDLVRAPKPEEMP
jgi:hypothetical protein